MKISNMKKIITLLKGKKNRDKDKIKIVLDTCILIHYFDGTGGIEHIQRIFSLLDNEIIDGFISVVTIAELTKHLRDLEKNGVIVRQSINEIMESVEDNLVIIPLEYDIANEAGEIKSKYSSKRQPLSYNDSFIASTAKALNAPLITCDGEFFKDKANKLHSRIDEIKVLLPRDFTMRSKLSKY